MEPITLTHLTGFLSHRVGELEVEVTLESRRGWSISLDVSLTPDSSYHVSLTREEGSDPLTACSCLVTSSLPCSSGGSPRTTADLIVVGASGPQCAYILCWNLMLWYGKLPTAQGGCVTTDEDTQRAIAAWMGRDKVGEER